MIAFQLLGIALLLLAVVVTVAAARRGHLSRGAATAWTALWLAAAVAIAVPNSTMVVAHALGIQRGADLVFYCAILAMPNTDPVIDSAAVLGALIDDAKTNAQIPVGFFASITRDLAGETLSDMVELAEFGAVGFTDDGRPVRSAGLMRRALQYSGAAGRILSLHEEEPTLARGGHMHEGAVSAELGIGGWPSIAESVMVFLQALDTLTNRDAGGVEDKDESESDRGLDQDIACARAKSFFHPGTCRCQSAQSAAGLAALDQDYSDEEECNQDLDAVHQIQKNRHLFAYFVSLEFKNRIERRI